MKVDVDSGRFALIGIDKKQVGQFGVQVCPILGRARLSETTGVIILRRGVRD